MYEAFYNLRGDPFRLLPDPRVCFPHRSCARAWEQLGVALRRGEGIVIVSGPPGSGKTMLAERLVSEASQASIVCTHLVADGGDIGILLRRLAYAFGLPPSDLDRGELTHRIERYLVELELSDRRALVVIDEAQSLPREALESLRRLVDLQSRSRPVLQLILFGQDDLDEVLASPQMAPFQHRVIAACRLESMDLAETKAYLEYRLARADWRGDPSINGPAVVAIYEESGGLPRHVNRICNRLFQHGSNTDRHALNERDVRAIVTDLRDESLAPADLVEVSSTRGSSGVFDPVYELALVPNAGQAVPTSIEAAGHQLSPLFETANTDDEPRLAATTEGLGADTEPGRVSMPLDWSVPWTDGGGSAGFSAPLPDTAGPGVESMRTDDGFEEEPPHEPPQVRRGARRGGWLAAAAALLVFGLAWLLPPRQASEHRRIDLDVAATLPQTATDGEHAAMTPPPAAADAHAPEVVAAAPASTATAHTEGVGTAEAGAAVQARMRDATPAASDGASAPQSKLVLDALEQLPPTGAGTTALSGHTEAEGGTVAVETPTLPGVVEPVVAVATPDDGGAQTIAVALLEPTQDPADEITRLSAAAEDALRRDHLLIPEDQSAVGYYRRIAALDGGDAIAEAGLARIVARYRELAESALAEQDFVAAQRFVDRALRVTADDAEVLALRGRIDEAQQESELAAQERERLREAELARLADDAAKQAQAAAPEPQRPSGLNWLRGLIGGGQAERAP